ncbi:hypothetical protein WA026_015042 [Henosepilachna vigintioctopunctata]|uniref:FHA domain-containing protein n=1 Tax=Henosepilachna vigintioctopunctata TaxID=420089 RepID=A0AAW1U821_9CUCU
MFEHTQDESHCVHMEEPIDSFKCQTDVPYLMNLGSDRLSTSSLYHFIPKGRVVLGSDPAVDIPVQGDGVAPIHCHIENNEGIVTVIPLAENISVDGIKVTFPTRLYEGSMLTIGRTNYMRFSNPTQVPSNKSLVDITRDTIPPMNVESENQFDLVKFLNKPPAHPKKSPRESFSDISREEPPSSFLTKLSKFEYLAAQNLRKSISPKVFTSNAITVNTPAKDVLGKSPPDLHSLTKNLSLSSSEKNYCVDNQKSKVEDQTLFGKKSHYVNVPPMDDCNSINSRVITYENGITHQNYNLYENQLNTKTSSGTKNINMLRVITPSPSYNRNPGPYHRNTAPNPSSRHISPGRRRSGSPELPTRDNFYDNIVDLNETKNEDEIKRNQVQQDRMKEQELERAEQARLEEILNMCAEYEKQSQNEKNKPITPNRIKTNGSLPRDKRPQMSPNSFLSSPYDSPSSPSVFDFQKFPQSAHENIQSNSSSWRSKITSNYENLNFNTFEEAKDRPLKDSNNYENIDCSPITSKHYPNSPRSKIKTFLTADKEQCLTRGVSNMRENEFSNQENEMYSQQSFSQFEEKPSINSIESISRKPTPTKFILPLEEIDVAGEKPSNSSNALNMFTDLNNSQCHNIEFKSSRSRYATLKKERRRLLDIVAGLKQLMSEIEVQEEELHIEMDMERALLSGEYKSKLLELEKQQQKKENLLKQIQLIDNIMLEAQHKRTEHEEECLEKLKNAKECMTLIEQKLGSTEKASEEYEAVFEQYLKTQEVLESEKKSFEDLEFHHLEEEANLLATREELQREIAEMKIENLESHIKELNQQALDTANANNNEYKSLETQKISCLVKLEGIRNRVKAIDSELNEYCDQEFHQETSSDTDSESTRNTDSKGDVNSMKHLSCSVVVSDSVLPSGASDNMFLSYNEKFMHDKIILEGGSGTRVDEQEIQSFQTSRHRNHQEVRNTLAPSSEELGSREKRGDIFCQSAENSPVPVDYLDGNLNDGCDSNHRPLSEVSEMSLEGGHTENAASRRRTNSAL